MVLLVKNAVLFSVHSSMEFLRGAVNRISLPGFSVV